MENKRNLPAEGIEKLITGIEGFDQIAKGGLPKGRTTLVSGTSGSGKTVLASQFLVMGIEKSGEKGVFVTFEESPEDIRKNLTGFDWDIEQYEKKEQWVFVDASLSPHEETIVTGEFDLTALLSRIEYAIKKIGANRVVMDSLGAVFSQFTDINLLRKELFRIASALKLAGVTSLMTAERLDEYGGISRYGIEEFVADNVIILRNILEEEKRHRTIEILKYRGTSHQKGEYTMTIVPGEGLIVIPLSSIELTQRSSNLRASSGNLELDRMCGGGFFRDSIILVSGATGTGKTLMTTEFISGGTRQSDRSLLFAFEESRDQLFRNAEGWGVNFEELENQGLLKVVCTYPEQSGLEDHLIQMKKIIKEFRPKRLAIDSLSALERISTTKTFREFVIALTSFIKHQEITGMFTSTTPTLMGGSSVTEAHISTITDSIVLLRYVEVFGELRRGITVLKMRGSAHEKQIFEYTIDGKGMHVGEAFHTVTGIISGVASGPPPCGRTQFSSPGLACDPSPGSVQ